MVTNAKALPDKDKRPAKKPQYATEEMLISSLLNKLNVEHNKPGALSRGEQIHPINPMDLITLARNGVPGNSIRSVAEKLDIALNDLYVLLHVTPRTAQRLMKSENLEVDISDRIIQLMKIHDRCMDVFQNKEKMIHWLKTPNFALGDQTPLSLLDTTDGIELVANSLTKIEYGVFA